MSDYPSCRLDHILIQNGLGSPRSVRTLLRNHTVLVNGVREMNGGVLVFAQKDRVLIDGKEIELKNDVYLMLNKPSNTVCTNLRGSHQTVFELIDPKYKNISGLGKLHSVGRLDLDTEGFVLLTTNGGFSHKLTSPESHVKKTYLAYLRDAVSEENRARYKEKFALGIEILPEKKAKAAITAPAALEWLSEDEAIEENPSSNGEDYLFTACRLSITEGKFHQVKRMFSALGNEVVYLKRIAIADVFLDKKLKPAEYRELTKEELLLLMR